MIFSGISRFHVISGISRFGQLREAPGQLQKWQDQLRVRRTFWIRNLLISSSSSKSCRSLPACFFFTSMATPKPVVLPSWVCRYRYVCKVCLVDFTSNSFYNLLASSYAFQQPSNLLRLVLSSSPSGLPHVASSCLQVCASFVISTFRPTSITVKTNKTKANYRKNKNVTCRYYVLRI